MAVVGVVAAYFLNICRDLRGRIGTGTVLQPHTLGLSAGFTSVHNCLGASRPFAGFILFMVAMHRLSNYYNEPDIFKNVLYAFHLKHNFRRSRFCIRVCLHYLVTSSEFPNEYKHINFSSLFHHFILVS